MTMLQLKNVSKVYDGKVPYRALEDVSLTVPKGSFVGLMGPSGSGKTTLLNIVSTIDRPTSGSVLIDGQNPHALAPGPLARFRRRELGFVFQDFNLLDTLTVRENIFLPLALDGVGAAEMQRRLDELADVLGIASILDKRTFEISGGQAQRTAIARAVIHRPKVLLADEPTGSLDSRTAREVIALFETVNRELGVTVLMVTHDPMAASYCRRVVFIKDGRIEQQIERTDGQPAFFGEIVDMMARLERTDDV